MRDDVTAHDTAAALMAAPGSHLDALVAAVHQRPEWHQRAACRGQVDLMFPPFKRGSPTPPEALALCQACPVVDECAAAGSDERFGVWAGVRRYAGRPGRGARPRRTTAA